MVVKATT